MAKPFISHDGVDKNDVRAEVYVETGTGTVDEIKENGKNVLIKMKVEGLRHPVQGWTSTSEAIFKTLVEAKDSGREVSYRIESQRKDGVARDIPISELRKTQDIANENTRKLFVGVDGVLSSEAVTNPAEDPHTGGRIPATDPRHAPKQQGAPAGAGGGFSAEQALSGLAKARQGGMPPTVVDAAAALALAAGASVEQVMAAGVDEQTPQQRREVRRAFAAEAKPFHSHNTDNRLNLGSYAVQAAVGAESLAADLISEQNARVAAAHNAAVETGEIAGEPIEPAPVDFKNAAALGRILLTLADRVQVDAYGGGRPDRMATSHSRARGLVYDAVKNRYPVPFGQDAEAQEEWKKVVAAEATLRLQYAAQISEPDAEQAPQASQSQSGQQGQQVERVEAGRPNGQQAGDGNGQVHQIAAQRKVPVEGDEGFVAPSDQIIERFRVLAQAAGFDGSPESPISAYLTRTFGVGTTRKVHGPGLDAMLTWYEQKGVEPGAEGAVKFHDKVLTTVAEPASA